MRPGCDSLSRLVIFQFRGELLWATGSAARSKRQEVESISNVPEKHLAQMAVFCAKSGLSRRAQLGVKVAWRSGYLFKKRERGTRIPLHGWEEPKAPGGGTPALLRLSLSSHAWPCYDSRARCVHRRRLEGRLITAYCPSSRASDARP